MREEIFKALEARWHELYDQYAAVKSALPPVVRWEWTNRERYDPRPCYFERNPPRGRIIKPPENNHLWKYYYEYGFANAEQLIVKQPYIGNKNLGETFYSYTPDKTEITTYSQHQDRYLLSSITWCVMKSGRMQDYANLTVAYYSIDPTLPYPGPGQVEKYKGEGVAKTIAEEIWIQLSQQDYAIQWHYEAYVYQGNQLVHIQNYLRYSLNRTIESEHFIEYGATGGLQKITRIQPDGERSLLYRKREPGETRAILSERVKTKLIEIIPHVVAAAKFTEPLYCLTLNYHSDIIESFPPTVLPAFESYRQKVLLEYPPKHVPGLVWTNIWDDEAYPDIPYPPLPIADPETLDACENFNADIRRGRDYGYMIRILREIARELNKLDWSQYAPVTPDFIIYDCDDTEHTEIALSLRLSGATKEQLAAWRKRGLL